MQTNAALFLQADLLASPWRLGQKAPVWCHPPNFPHGLSPPRSCSGLLGEWPRTVFLQSYIWYTDSSKETGTKYRGLASRRKGTPQDHAHIGRTARGVGMACVSTWWINTPDPVNPNILCISRINKMLCGKRSSRSILEIQRKRLALQHAD